MQGRHGQTRDTTGFGSIRPSSSRVVRLLCDITIGAHPTADGASFALFRGRDPRGYAGIPRMIVKVKIFKGWELACFVARSGLTPVSVSE